MLKLWQHPFGTTVNMILMMNSECSAGDRLTIRQTLYKLSQFFLSSSA